MARHVCNVLKIFFLLLAKPKPLKSFNGKPARPITHAIYPTLTVQGHSELLAPMLVTSLGQHPIILGKPWMRKHGVILDMSCDKLTFWPGHCQHSGIEKSVAPPVKELALTLKINEPIGKEQAASINTLKYVIAANRKAVPKATPKAVLPKVILKAPSRSAALPRAEKPTKPLELAMVGAAPFQYLTKQKSVEIFGISMRDLKY